MEKTTTCPDAEKATWWIACGDKDIRAKGEQYFEEHPLDVPVFESLIAASLAQFIDRWAHKLVVMPDLLTKALKIMGEKLEDIPQKQFCDILSGLEHPFVYNTVYAIYVKRFEQPPLPEACG